MIDTNENNATSEVLWPERYGPTLVVLEKGECFKHPTKPGQFLYGPMILEFHRWHDGGIDVFIRAEKGGGWVS